jgi:hypothetical protein
MVAVLFAASTRNLATIRIGGFARDRRIIRGRAATLMARELVRGLGLDTILVTAPGTTKPFCIRVLFGTHGRLLG